MNKDFFRGILIAFIAGQLAIVPALILTPTFAFGQESNAVQAEAQISATTPSEEESSTRADFSKGISPIYSLPSEALSNPSTIRYLANHSVPVENIHLTMIDPATQKQERVTITYGVSHNKQQFDALTRYTEYEVKKDQYRGYNPRMIIPRVDNEPVPPFHLSAYGLRPSDALQVEINTKKLAQFKSWSDLQIQKLRDRFQRAQAEAWLNKMDAQRAKQLKRELKEAKQTNSRYGRFVRWFMTKKITNRSPWKIGKEYKKDPTYAYEATFALLRTAGIYEASMFSLTHGAVPLPMLGVILTSAVWGLGSGYIMLNGRGYLRWYNHDGLMSKTMRTGFKLAAWPVAKALGYSRTNLNTWEYKFNYSLPFRLVHQMGKYVLTELPFVAIPGFIFEVACHYSIYPAAHFATAPLLALGYVLTKLGHSAWQGYEGQGIPDTTTSNIVHGIEQETLDKMASGKLNNSAGEIKIADVNFKSLFVVFGTAMASNAGVVLGMIPHSPVANHLGLEVINTLKYAGIAGLTYAIVRYDRHARNYLLSKWNALKDNLFQTAFPPPDSKSCAQLLSVRSVI